MDLRCWNKKVRKVEPVHVGKDYVLKVRGETSPHIRTVQSAWMDLKQLKNQLS